MSERGSAGAQPETVAPYWRASAILRAPLTVPSYPSLPRFSLPSPTAPSNLKLESSVPATELFLCCASSVRPHRLPAAVPRWPRPSYDRSLKTLPRPPRIGSCRHDNQAVPPVVRVVTSSKPLKTGRLSWTQRPGGYPIGRNHPRTPGNRPRSRSSPPPHTPGADFRRLRWSFIPGARS